MQTMNISLWSDFKTLVTSKKLLLQYTESERAYEIFAPEAHTFLWATTLIKGSSDADDFEDNFKSNANSPMESKADAGRPERVAPSPQPNDTTEKWKGFHLEMDAEDSSATIDISFDVNVYLKGGTIYAGDCSSLDYVSADIVLKANPAYVIKAGILNAIYMLPGDKINFMSSECMFMPTTVMLRVTYTKGTPTNTARSVSALADYFETIA